jgi:hypothetical protein
VLQSVPHHKVFQFTVYPDGTITRKDFPMELVYDAAQPERPLPGWPFDVSHSRPLTDTDIARYSPKPKVPLLISRVVSLSQGPPLAAAPAAAAAPLLPPPEVCAAVAFRATGTIAPRRAPAASPGDSATPTATATASASTPLRVLAATQSCVAAAAPGADVTALELDLATPRLSRSAPGKLMQHLDPLPVQPASSPSPSKTPAASPPRLSPLTASGARRPAAGAARQRSLRSARSDGLSGAAVQAPAAALATA